MELLEHAREVVSVALATGAVPARPLGGGLAGWMDVAGARVFAGRPVAAPSELEAVERASLNDVARAVRFGRELEEADPLPEDAYVVGEQPWWELARWPETVARTRSLRTQLRRAERHGVAVREVTRGELSPGSPAHAALAALVHEWLSARPMPALAFVASVRPLAALHLRRVFLAEVGGRPVAALFTLPLPARGAWVLDHLVRRGRPPNGTSELLVDHAFRTAAASGASRATLGLCPLAGRVPAPLRWARQPLRGLYDFEGLYAFKARLHPHAWQRVLVEHPGQSALAGTVRALRAFAGGSLAAFALRTVFRHRGSP